MYCGIGTTIAIPIYKVLPYLVIQSVTATETDTLCIQGENPLYYISHIICFEDLVLEQNIPIGFYIQPNILTI